MKKKLIILLFLIISLLAFCVPKAEDHQIQFVLRGSKSIQTEKVFGEKWLIWLYHNPFGNLATQTIIKRKFISEYYGKQMDKKSSKSKIEPFIEQYDIDMSIVLGKNFENFNDFFVRKLKPNARPIDKNQGVVISPADGKILGYQNIERSDFIVKGYKFNLGEFLLDETLAKKFEGGSLLIIRLCPTDYHRYHFPISGKITKSQKIQGSYYSVSPTAIKKMVELFCLNKREYTLITTENFGDVLMSEIGATMVGSIISTYDQIDIKKGQEKGYFKFGGSSIILLFEKNKILIDEDILENTQKRLETQVFWGERIAIKKDEF